MFNVINFSSPESYTANAGRPCVNPPQTNWPHLAACNYYLGMSLIASRVPLEPPGVALRLVVQESATNLDRVEAGIAAATSLLHDRGVTPWQAAWAHWWREANSDATTAQEHAWARAWEEAQQVARDHCGVGDLAGCSLELSIPETSLVTPVPRGSREATDESARNRRADSALRPSPAA